MFYIFQLSPKKTWEGFIGGFFATMVFGVIVSKTMYQFKHLICPVEVCYNVTTRDYVVKLLGWDFCQNEQDGI